MFPKCPEVDEAYQPGIARVLVLHGHKLPEVIKRPPSPPVSSATSGRRPLPSSEELEDEKMCEATPSCHINLAVRHYSYSLLLGGFQKWLVLILID